MATKAEADKILARIKVAMEQHRVAEEAAIEAREVLRDAYALIGAMADELAERSES